MLRAYTVEKKSGNVTRMVEPHFTFAVATLQEKKHSDILTIDHLVIEKFVTGLPSCRLV